MKGFLALKEPRDLLEKLEDDRERLRTNPTSSHVAFDFCVTAWHIVDWKFPNSKDPGRAAFLARLPLLRVCEHLAVGAKHFEPDPNRHKSVTGGESPNPWGSSWGASWAPGRWGGPIVIHLDGDAKTAFGDSIGLQELADAVLALWRKEI